MAEGKLKKIEVTGGPPQKICDAPSGSDGTWSSEGVILFDGQASDPIYRVSAAGGDANRGREGRAGAKGSRGRMAGVPPRRQHFLYMVSGQKAEDSVYRIGSLDSKEARRSRPRRRS